MEKDITHIVMEKALLSAVPCKRCKASPIMKYIDGMMYVQCPNPQCLTCQYDTYSFLALSPKMAVAAWNDIMDKNSEYNKNQRKHNKEERTL